MAMLPTSGLAADSRSLAALRSEAARDPKTAAKEAAKQFEAIFMQELLKSMRAASAQTGLFDNEASKLGTEMLDGQMAVSFAGRPGGLSELIARQLERQMGLAPGPIPKTKPAALNAGSAAELAQPTREVRIPDRAAAAFVRQHAGQRPEKSAYALVDGRAAVFFDGVDVGGGHAGPHKAGHIAGAGNVPYNEVVGDDLKLKRGQPALAIIKATEVMVARSGGSAGER